MQKAHGERDKAEEGGFVCQRKPHETWDLSEHSCNSFYLPQNSCRMPLSLWHACSILNSSCPLQIWPFWSFKLDLVCIMIIVTICFCFFDCIVFLPSCVGSTSQFFIGELPPISSPRVSYGAGPIPISILLDTLILSGMATSPKPNHWETACYFPNFGKETLSFWDYRL